MRLKTYFDFKKPLKDLECLINEGFMWRNIMIKAVLKVLKPFPSTEHSGANPEHTMTRK